MIELAVLGCILIVLSAFISWIVEPKVTEITKDIIVEEVKQNEGGGCAVLIVLGLSLGTVGGVALLVA